MVKIANPATEENIESAISKWLYMLAKEMYKEAFEFTLHEPYYNWTPVLLEKVINGYGLPHEGDTAHKYKVTNWKEANKPTCKRYKEINLFNEQGLHRDVNFKIAGDIFYDLPLDGEWSDLTASFKILQAIDFTTLELNEIHVF